jgi:ABC-2 type transport system permease protein
MRQFGTLFCLGLKRRSKDFFILFYNIVFPIVIILLMGYLTSTSYGTTFTSYHYYSIVIIPFSALMGITTVSYAAQEEKRLHTAYRYIVAPINKKAIILSKFVSSAIVLSICNGVTFLIAMFLFGLDFGGYLLIVILLLTCETISVTGIGLYLGLACKNLDALRNFMNIPIVIFGFLGGAFFPVYSSNTVLAFLIKFSPLTWINWGIISCIYDDQIWTIGIISCILLLLGSIMTVLTIVFFKKEAFL